MAGSYRHVTEADGSWLGFDLLDNRADDGQTIDEMWKMIAWMGARLTPDDPRRAIHEAWLEGYLRPLDNGNADIPSLASFESFWSDE